MITSLVALCTQKLRLAPITRPIVLLEIGAIFIPYCCSETASLKHCEDRGTLMNDGEANFIYYRSEICVCYVPRDLITRPVALCVKSSNGPYACLVTAKNVLHSVDELSLRHHQYTPKATKRVRDPLRTSEPVTIHRTT